MRPRHFGIAVAFWAVLSLPAQAWEFTPGTPCLLRHQTDEIAVELTYDPSIPVYTILLTQSQIFENATVFAMQFQGQAPISISTGQHVYSNTGKTVTVTDSGFGNVLNGLQFNQMAIATLGSQRIAIPLIDAADAVAAFRACDVIPAV
jgi:hypothetical protein